MIERFKRWVRLKISMPIANKIIGANKIRTVVVERNGVYYAAEYHRAPFWFDKEPITIRNILKKRKLWFVHYWDKGTVYGFGGREMGLRPWMPFIESNSKDIAAKVTDALNVNIDAWLER